MIQLYLRYNSKEADQATTFQTLPDVRYPIATLSETKRVYQDESKSDGPFADHEKTSDTVVDIESYSDGHLDLGHPPPTPSVDVPLKRRKVHTPNRTTKRESIPRTAMADQRVCVCLGSNGRRHEPVGRLGGGWSAFPPRQTFAAEPGFNDALDQASLFGRRFKEEPYSAAQQILRLEDIPPFLMSINRQGNEYGMSVPSVGSESARGQDAFLTHSAPTSCPIYLLEPEARRILDIYESCRQPNLSSTLMTQMPNGPPQQDMQSPAGHGPYPYFDSLSDAGRGHLGGQQFPVENGLAQSALNYVQDAMFPQSIFRSAAPSYNLPPSSHNPHT